MPVSPPPSKAIAHQRAKIANRVRFHGPDDPELAELRRKLKILELVEHFERTVDCWPPFTDEQFAKLDILLEPVRERIYQNWLASHEASG